jgi:hypothetical protein
LFKIRRGDCIGGYTQNSWDSDYVHNLDNDAILFNLNCRRSFPSVKNTGGIKSSEVDGPCFKNDQY